MAKFIKWSNNATTAVVTEKTYEDLLKRRELLDECSRLNKPQPDLPPVKPVFTFGNEDHSSFRFMTGSLSIMHWLLRGHEVVNTSITVPFSNGSELGYHGDDARDAELQYCTSLDEAMEAFGLVPSFSTEREESLEGFGLLTPFR
jgi:hypothetical protein